MFGLLMRTWRAAAWIGAGYSLYNHLKTLKAEKDALYEELPPQLQEQWVMIFGKPGPVVVPNPVTPEIEQVSART